MPLVVICGQPSSGKSTVARRLAQELQAAGVEALIVDEPSLHLKRDESYRDMPSEKNTRGHLRSEVERHLARHRKAATLFDSLNNIKGYRYELWCVARAAGTTYCMVHVDTPDDVCASWNAARAAAGEEAYSEHIYKDIAARFERPDSRNRWDAPLFTVRPAGDQAEYEAAIASIVAAVAPAQAAAAAAAAAASGAGAGGGEEGCLDGPPMQMVAKQLQPTTATANATLLGTNVLHDIDAAAQTVIDAITEAQAAAAGGAPGLVTIRFGAGEGQGPAGPAAGSSNGGVGGGDGEGQQGSGNIITLKLDQPVTLAELRRHKRAFLKLATKVTFARLGNGLAAGRLYADYLAQHVAGAMRLGGGGAGGFGAGC